MLAIDRYYYIDVHIFDSKLVKNAFARCLVPFRGFHAFKFPKWTSVKLDLFPCLARDRKSLPQRRIVADIFGKEVDLHWREVCSTNSVLMIRSQ